MKRCLILILIFCLSCTLFTGCTDPEPYVPTGDALEYEDGSTGPVVTPTGEAEPQQLSLTYYPNVTLNPYTCTDFTNKVILCLIYQGLFATDRDYNPTPILCKNFRVSDDLRIYTFYLEDATFSDGSPLTPQDVVDSLLAAKTSERYSGRFYFMEEVTVAPDGGVTVRLSHPYENFPLLLDVPIIKSTQLEQEMPLGTGPYVFSQLGGSASLRRRNNWWCNPDMVVTADTIALIPAESINQIRDNFQFGGLDVVCADPGSDRYADYRSDFELWDCETGIFLYMVFSSYSDVFENNELQAAVTYAINRELLVSEYYRGFAQAASLPASPNFPYYSQTLAKRYDYEPEKFAEAVQKANLGDTKVRILVNSKDSLRTRVAQDICEMLEAGGMQTELVAVSGDTYKYTLNAWDFDIYLGQTILSPNMDLSPYFFMYGTLKQGGTTDLAAYALCLQALENHGNYYTLHQDVMDRGLICPILFRSYAVYATRGLVTDLTPARDNIFYYNLGKTMETALLP